MGSILLSHQHQPSYSVILTESDKKSNQINSMQYGIL